MRRSTKISRSIFRSFLIGLVGLTLTLALGPFLSHVSASSIALDGNLCSGGSCIFAQLSGDTSNITVTAINQNAALTSWNFTLKHIPQIGNGDVWGASQDTTGDPVCPCQTLQNPNDPSAKYTIYVKRNGTTIAGPYSTTTHYENLNDPIPKINVPSGTKPVQNTIIKGTIDVKGSDGKTEPARTWTGARTLPAVQLKASDGTTFDQASLGLDKAHNVGTFTLTLKPGSDTYTGSFDIQDPNYSTNDLQFTLPGIQVTPGTNTIAVHVNEPSPNGGNSANGTYTGNGTTAAGKHYSTSGSFGQFAKPPPSSSSGTSTEKATCESSGLSLSWFICPIVNGLADASDGIFNSFIKPFLQTSVIQVNNPQDPIFRAWSNFRTIANILLIVALLVAVFSEAAGGGLLDAYTVKKMLPRLLIAAILINISIYLVAGLLDIFNIIGNGLYDLILKPFGGTGILDIRPNGGASTIVLIVLAAFVAAAVIGKGSFFAFIFLFVLLPLLLAMLGVFLTLLIRQGLIIFLVIVSPVAFTLYALPNTEKYFKKWWEELVKALMLYPIIVTLFAMANVLAGLLSNANGTNSSGPREALSNIASLIVMVIPLFAIPFAFKFSSSILSNTASTLAGWGKKGHEGILGNPNLESSLRNRTRRNLGASYTRAGAQTYRRLGKSRFGKTALGSRATALLGSTIEKEAQLNEASKKRIFSTKDNGDDSILNAAASFVDTDGKRKTLDGKEVKPADWHAAQRLYPNFSDIQTVADYRSTKINSSEQAEQFTNNFARMAKQRGLSLEETQGAFTALAFARQNERNEYKHGKWVEQNGDYVFQRAGNVADNLEGTDNYVTENYHKKGSFDASRALSSHYQAMGDAKEGYLQQFDDASARLTANAYVDDAAGTAAEKRNADIGLRDNARDKVKQIVEMEQAWESPTRNEEGELIGGMHGASAASLGAFNQMKQRGAGHALTQQVKAEVSYGQTWEAEQSGRPY